MRCGGCPMSDDNLVISEVSLLGAGCATLSLGARANEFKAHSFIIVDSGKHLPKDHIWGFWFMPWLAKTDKVIRKRWSNWQIISPEKCITHSSKLHPYCALNRNEWINTCSDQAKKNEVKFTRVLNSKKQFQIIDSRPPPIPKGTMLQHFSGYEIETPIDIFDDTIATLMDFRCDQSLGMHFIYCLPFSKRHALVESTIFSPTIAPQEFYDKAIKNYLKDVKNLDDFDIIRSEAGAIPLAVLKQRDISFTGIGGNGGAIRPSSGYAFSFIQKQVEQIVNTQEPGHPLKVKVPHSQFEIWMDKIFLAVIRKNPLLAPLIFTNMAQSLNGDDFACFLSGQANLKIWCRVVLSMPKIPFITALFGIVFKRKLK